MAVSDQVSTAHVPSGAPGGRSTTAQPTPPSDLSGPALPVLAAVGARPWWLLTGAVLGAVLGALLASGSGFTASASLQSTGGGQDGVRVQQVAQTTELLATSTPVLEIAAAARKVPVVELRDRVTALWQDNTDLINVVAVAPDRATAVADANAVAEAAVQINQRDAQVRLARLRREANRLLTTESLGNTAAEQARRNQLGASFATRQDAINAEAESVFVADPAVDASPAGLNRTTGGLVGLLGGLLLAALLAVLMGARRLRVRGAGTVHSVLPGARVRTLGDAGEVAGRLVETRIPCLAVIALPGARDESMGFAREVADFVRGHGLSVTVVDTASLTSRAARRDVLRFDLRDNVPHAFGSDVVVLVIDSEDDAHSMLAGQSNLRAAVVVHRQRTTVGRLAQLLESLDRAEPVVILAR